MDTGGMAMVDINVPLLLFYMDKRLGWSRRGLGRHTGIDKATVKSVNETGRCRTDTHSTILDAVRKACAEKNPPMGMPVTFILEPRPDGSVPKIVEVTEDVVVADVILSSRVGAVTPEQITEIEEAISEVIGRRIRISSI
mgnify:CR=1 FL=1